MAEALYGGRRSAISMSYFRGNDYEHFCSMLPQRGERFRDSGRTSLLGSRRLKFKFSDEVARRSRDFRRREPSAQMSLKQAARYTMSGMPMIYSTARRADLPRNADISPTVCRKFRHCSFDMPASLRCCLAACGNSYAARNAGHTWTTHPPRLAPSRLTRAYS